MSVLKDDVKTISELWGASIYFPKSEGDIRFNYSAIEVKRNTDTTIETNNPYFISKDISTCYFDKLMLDKVYKISDSLTVFYSESKDKCIEWLEKKREGMILYHGSCYKRLLESEIKEKK